jgi:tRNA G46 methylase TrmB
MEIIRGKKTSFITGEQFTEIVNPYSTIHLDIGTGDGRFVRHLAQTDSQQFIIGIDACRENLHSISRQRLDNALFVIANARA